MNQPLSSIDAAAASARFAAIDRLTVREREAWTAALMGVDAKHSYRVYDGDGEAVFVVREVGEGEGEYFRRMVLGRLRPFTAHVIDRKSDEVILRLERRFRLLLHVLEVFAGDGQPLGSIERRSGVPRRRYEVKDAAGRTLAEIESPLLKPWTFELSVQGEVVGVIRKKWSGLGKELFTDADDFGVELAGIADARLRALAFAATVLIDVVHFEGVTQ